MQKNNYWKKQVTAIGITMLLTAVSLGGCGKKSVVANQLEAIRLQTEMTAQEQLQEPSGADMVSGQEMPEDTAEQVVIIHVCGAVADDGVYELPVNARIDDAIAAAGGFTEEADREYLNLAQHLTDGLQIRVPTREEVQSGQVQKAEAGAASDAAVPGAGKTEGDSASNGKIDLNHADKAALMKIPGIGETKATSILEYREAHGTFRSLEELKNIPGIKDGILDKIKDYVTL